MKGTFCWLYSLISLLSQLRIIFVEIIEVYLVQPNKNVNVSSKKEVCILPCQSFCFPSFWPRKWLRLYFRLFSCLWNVKVCSCNPTSAVSFHAGMQYHGICQTWEGMLGLWGRQVNSMQADWGTDRFRRLAEQFPIFHSTLSFSLFFIIFWRNVGIAQKVVLFYFSNNISFPMLL